MCVPSVYDRGEQPRHDHTHQSSIVRQPTVRKTPKVNRPCHLKRLLQHQNLTGPCAWQLVALGSRRVIYAAHPPTSLIQIEFAAAFG